MDIEVIKEQWNTFNVMLRRIDNEIFVLHADTNTEDIVDKLTDLEHFIPLIKRSLST